MKTFFLAILLILPLLATDALIEKALSKGLKPIPRDFETLKSQVDDPENPMSIAKIRLGKKLFFDKNLSKDRSLACAKCHDIKNGGEDGKPTAIGYHELPNPSHLNTPTVLNTAFSKHLFWDGRVSTLREQAKGPAQAPFEMASTPELIEERVKENQEYHDAFREVFGDDCITFDNVARAIAVYEKTLVTRGKFDDFLEGDSTALNKQEKRGLNLFIDMGCKGCHFGSAVGGQKIQKFPLRDYNSIIDLTTDFNEETKGRSISQISFNFDMYHPYPFENKGGFMGKDGQQMFRVPVLRDISKTAPYFHNGVVKTLREAIEIMSKNQIGVDMSKGQIDAMEAFLKALDGKIVDYNLYIY
ncbi:MAG: cytochrome c peroxidase [Campylobacterota bacterium]|nr:cytochrome c peroxidase [Campylobacterota bacterium]